MQKDAADILLSSLGPISKLHASLTIKVETRQMAKRSRYPSYVEHKGDVSISSANFMHV